MFEVSDIVKVSKYFSKIHHIDGRLRVRVNPAIKDEIEGVSLKDIESISSKIAGIEQIKVNRVIASITIKYDSSIFSYQIWEDLLNQRNLEEILKEINRLSKEVLDA